MASAKQIPADHLVNVCLFGQGEQCCSFVLMGPRGWECAKSKGNAGFFDMILEKRLAGEMKAMGNNCNGIDPDPDIPPVK